MALRVIEGVPGSGKTFYAVWHLALNYFRKVPHYTVIQVFFYTILPFLRPPGEQKYIPAKDCLIITNIDNFKPDHVDLAAEIKKAGDIAHQLLVSDTSLSDRERDRKLDQLDPVAEFFSYSYQEKYKEGKSQIVYVIDEAQVFFRKGQEKALKEKEVYRYFEYHRHWGQDIYLVTQNIKKLPSDIVYLPEYTITAVPRVRSLGPGFRYHWMASGERIKTEVRRADQAVFALYKSMDVAEQEKIKNPVLKAVGLALAGSAVILFYGYSYVTDRFGGKDQTVAESTPDLVVSAAPVVPSPVLGNSYIPVGDPDRFKPAPVVPRYVVFLPLDSITRLSRNKKRVERLYVWRGQLLPASSFPHETVYMSGRRYAVLDYELFDFMFSNEEERPTDFIVQVANPTQQPGDGAGANDRSAARSDLSGGQTRRGAQATSKG
jgi:hypothetical protein